MKYLKKGETILPVLDVYAYRYDYGKGKTVLRLKVSDKVDFSELQKFFSETADYEYYDGQDGSEVLKTIYTRYGADLDIHYKRPADIPEADDSVTHTEASYDIEVMRDPEIEATVRSLQAANAALVQQAATLEAQNAVLIARAEEADLLMADLLYGM